jgi:hypothetical protein
MWLSPTSTWMPQPTNPHLEIFHSHDEHLLKGTTRTHSSVHPPKLHSLGGCSWVVELQFRWFLTRIFAILEPHGFTSSPWNSDGHRCLRASYPHRHSHRHSSNSKLSLLLSSLQTFVFTFHFWVKVGVQVIFPDPGTDSCSGRLSCVRRGTRCPRAEVGGRKGGT